uniref:lysozyme n=1 Tax=Timema poppense TaxID=170557 RepID=A0A7R9CKY6_TIMPO|nr:unnamed protein product [Timema poppensis]
MARMAVLLIRASFVPPEERVYRIILEGTISGVIIGSSENKVAKAVNEICLVCICEVLSGCDRNVGCVKDVCGLFQITRPYWVDSGRPVLANDDPNNNAAFTRCASDSFCSARAVENYTSKYRKVNYDVIYLHPVRLGLLLLCEGGGELHEQVPQGSYSFLLAKDFWYLQQLSAPLAHNLCVGGSLVQERWKYSTCYPSYCGFAWSGLVCSSQSIVYGRLGVDPDCNGDGVVNCFDYFAIHHFGGFGCEDNLEENFKVKLQSCLEELQESDVDYS